jgi:uncharacterized membrane protein YphA (DoxX/SURF4 family)
MSVKTAWNRFWFSDAPYLDLAILRIIAVFTQLFYLIDAQFSRVQYALGLPARMYEPMLVLKFFVWPLGFDVPPGPEIVMPIYGLTVLAGFMALFGILTRVTAVVFALGCLFVTAFLFSFGDMHHPEAVMLIGLIVISLSPCAKVLSVDGWLSAKLAERRGEPRASVPLLEARSPYAGWPVRFLQCFYPLMYISAAVAKIGFADYSFDWANGYTLQYYMIQDSIRKGLPLAMWTSQFHTFVWLGQIVVLVFQLTYFLVVPYPRLRWIYVPLGATFHLANYVILYAPFPQWIALLLGAYIPWTLALKKLASTSVKLEPAVAGGH